MDRKLRRLAVAGLVGGVLMLGGAVTVAAQTGDDPTFGRIPPGAISEDGQTVDMEEIPDFISVAAGKGEIVGYVKRTDLFSASSGDGPKSESLTAYVSGPASPEEAPAVVVEVYDVFDSTGKTVVGHWVTGAGFVPLSGDVDAAVQSVMDGATDSGSGESGG